MGTVPFDIERQFDTALMPATAEFVGGDRHRSEGCGRLCLVEPEAGLDLPLRKSA